MTDTDSYHSFYKHSEHRYIILTVLLNTLKSTIGVEKLLSFNIIAKYSSSRKSLIKLYIPLILSTSLHLSPFASISSFNTLSTSLHSLLHIPLLPFCFPPFSHSSHTRILLQFDHLFFFMLIHLPLTTSFML